MTGSRKILLSMATLAALLTAGTPALADDRDRDDRDRKHYSRHDDRHDKRYDKHRDNRHVHRDNGRVNYYYERNVGRPQIIRIYDNDRVILSRYVNDNYRRSYPKHRYYNYPRYQKYIVGERLPNGVMYYSVPYEVRSRLRPTPIGYQYVRVDNDVLLMNSTTKMIADAVSMLASGYFK